MDRQGKSGVSMRNWLMLQCRPQPALNEPPDLMLYNISSEPIEYAEPTHKRKTKLRLAFMLRNSLR